MDCKGCPVLAEGREPAPHPGSLYKSGWPLVMFVGHAYSSYSTLLDGGEGILKHCLESYPIAAYLTDVYSCERNYQAEQDHGAPGAHCRQALRDDLIRLEPDLVVTIGQSCQALFDKSPSHELGIFQAPCFPHKYLASPSGPTVQAIMLPHPANKASYKDLWNRRWQQMIAFLEEEVRNEA